LAHLKPREPSLDAVAIAYESGRRSAAWRLGAWRAVAAILLLATALIPLLRPAPPAPRTIERIVYAPASSSATALIVASSSSSSAMNRQATLAPAGNASYLHLR